MYRKQIKSELLSFRVGLWWELGLLGFPYIWPSQDQLFVTPVANQDLKTTVLEVSALSTIACLMALC